MRLHGTTRKDGRWWLAEVPVLDAMTQGRTRAKAHEMVVDLVETMVNAEGFRARVHRGPGDTFELSVSDLGPLVAVMLRRLRRRSGRSLAEVAKRLGHSSRNAYARYEQGRAVPTVEKLAELLRSVDCDVVLDESRA